MERELKQRLFGASLAIALAIIFVPMLFDGDGDGGPQTISIKVPEQPQNLEVKNFEIDRPVNSQPTPTTPPAEVELQQTVVEADANEAATELKPELKVIDQQSAEPSPSELSKEQIAESEPAAETEQKTATETAKATVKQVVATAKQPKPETQKQPQNSPAAAEPTAVSQVTKPSSPTVNQTFRVKLGSFSKQANAQKVKNSLLQKNISTVVEKDQQRQLYHVWSKQLYKNKTSAEQYITAVKAVGLNIGNPKVVTSNTQQVAQTVTQTQLGQVVQLGVFSSADNAIKLRNKVLAAGFGKAFVDQISNNSGKPIYRLRVGPFAEPKDALATQQKIKQRLKISGLIKTHQQAKLVQ